MYTNSTENIWYNKKAKNNRQEVEKCFPGFLAFIDCIEQQIPTISVDKERKKIYYSGKKKRHTIENQLMVNNRGFIIYKANYKKGKRHDYDVYKNNHPATSKQVVNVIDLGYIGIEKDFPQQLCPPYHAKGKEIRFYLKKKQINRFHSKKRIVIEHIICRLKKYRIMSNIFRNKLKKYNQVSNIVIGLVNYRLMNKQEL